MEVDFWRPGVALAAALMACSGPRVDLTPRQRLPDAPRPPLAATLEVDQNDDRKFEEDASLALRSRCKMNHLAVLWLQSVLDGWRVVHTSLGLFERDAGVPWMIVYDGFCQWSVATPPDVHAGTLRPAGALAWRGRPIPIAGAPHRGTLVLPDGRRIPARAMAFASTHRGRSFFVLALRSLWLEDFDETKGEDLDRFFAGIAVHELMHTQQILKVQAQVSVLHAYSSGAMPGHINDNSLSEVFVHEPDYGEALSNERELLHRAMLAQDPSQRRGFARRALDSICRRRVRFHVGERAWATKVEDLLLAMEGMAVWAHLEVSKRMTEISATPRPVTASPDQTAVFLAERSIEYVQDAGFSMTYLVDVLAPDWPRRGAFQLLQSPVRLLEVATHRGPSTPVGQWFGPACQPDTEAEEPLVPGHEDSSQTDGVASLSPQ